MDNLKFESNPGRQTMLSWACIVPGIVLVTGFRHFDSHGMTNSLAGFLAGLLLLLIGISALLVRGKQTVVIDTAARCIVVEDKNRFRTKKRSIRFGDIVDTGVGYLGKKSNFVAFYYINLKLRSGENYALFPPGYFFAGGSDRSVIEARRQRLVKYLAKQDHFA